VTRALDARLDLWHWRDEVSANPASARTDISVTVLDFQGMEIRRDHHLLAWPRSIELTVSGTNNTAIEKAVIVSEGKAGISFDPTLTLIAPATNSVFWNPTNLTIQATASLPAAVEKLEFFAGANLIGTAAAHQNGAFTVSWTNPPAGDHTLSAIATDPFGATYASKNVIPISILYGLTYDAWRLTSGYFLGKALLNPAVSGPYADPDKDRVPNLLEYAAGTNPNSALDYPKVQLTRGSDGLWFDYRRRVGGIASGLHQYQYADARYVVETSTDLQAWVPATSSFTEATAPIIRNAVFENVSLRLNAAPTGTAPRYFRLRVELLP
jgi:hypothetical protein